MAKEEEEEEEETSSQLADLGTPKPSPRLTGISRLDELGLVLDRLSGTTVNLLEEGVELAGNVGGVAIENGRVTVSNLSGVVHDDNLGVEGSGL